MGKKKSTVSSKHYKNAKWMKLLASIGGVLSLIFHGMTPFYWGSADIVQMILFMIIGIIVDIILLGSLNIINHKFVIKMTWISLFILGVLDAISFRMSNTSVNPGYVGTLLIIIAAVIGLIDRI